MRCALIGASDFAEERFSALNRVAPFDYIIAVDGGLAHVRASGLVADVALGDFDSLGFVPGSDLARTVQTFSPEKDATDFELALRRAKADGATEVFVFGVEGGRFDHTLGAVHTAAAFADAFDTLVIVGARFILHVVGSGRTLTLGPSGARYVSVLSAVDCSQDVVIRGLKYEYEGDLAGLTSFGISNEFCSAPARISVGQGVLFVIEQLY